jgi:serine/threonine kinase 38
MTDKYKDLAVSKATKEKVEAAKNFIEQRYSKMIHLEQQKRDYWEQLNQKMQTLGMSSLEQTEFKKQISHDEAQQMRQERKKITIYDFKPVKIIGKGAFGEVRLCKWSKATEPVAVKKLKKSEMIFKNKVMQSREERNVLANSENNPWVVGLKFSFQDPDSLYLVMEYLPGGDLMNLLMKKDIFTHEEAQFYTAEMLIALDTVHKMKYIHRDLKPDNVLLDANGHIKLSDFGLCKHTEIKPKRPLDNLMKKEEEMERLENTKNDFGKEFHKRNRKLAYSAVGTPDYVAPEVQGKRKDELT